MQHLTYPIALIFIGPTWLWMLWAYSSLAYEMNGLLDAAKEDDDESIILAQRAWKAFTGNTFSFVIFFILSGWASIEWVKSDYDSTVFFWQFICGITYFSITSILEMRFLEWSNAEPPSNQAN